MSSQSNNPIYQTLEMDELNIQVSKRQFASFGILPLLERIPGLFDALEAEIQGHLRQKTLPYLQRRVEEDRAKVDLSFQVAIFMFQLARNQFLYTMGHLLRGHTMEVFPHLRSMIECVGYAKIISTKPDLAELYLDGDVKSFKKRTASNELFPKGTPISEHLKSLYDSCSESTHNNLTNLVMRHKLSYETESGEPEFSSAVLFHDAEDDALEHVLMRALYVAYACHRTLGFFTEVFELPDSVIHRRLDQFEKDRLESLKALKKKYKASFSVANES